MRYLQRDRDGKVLGHYACPQSFTTEEVADDHPDILAWHARRKAEQEDAAAQSPSKRLNALEARIAKLEALLLKK